MSRMEFNFNAFYDKWKYFHCAFNLTGIFAAVAIGDASPWLISQLISFSLVLVSIIKSLSFKPIVIGYANCITLTRLIIILILGFSYNELDNFTLFVWFLFTICLDGVDGFLARKFRHSSNQGEIFDMEVDSFMVLLLCWIHFDINDIGWWILIPGSLRYSFEFLNSWIKKHEITQLPKKVRSSIAVLFFLSLLGPFVLSNSFAHYLLILATCFIFISFFAPILLCLLLKLRK